MDAKAKIHQSSGLVSYSHGEYFELEEAGKLRIFCKVTGEKEETLKKQEDVQDTKPIFTMIGTLFVVKVP